MTVGLILVNTFLDFDRSPFNVSSQAESGSAFGEGSKQLHWHSCGNRFECANLSVPLDWLNTDDTRTASIAITRYLASNRTNATDKGTIIFNPGGPGGSGTGSTWRIGPLLDEILQGQYDVLGFDPRGIKKTTPEVTCLKSAYTRMALEQILTTTAPSLNYTMLAYGMHSNSSLLKSARRTPALACCRSSTRLPWHETLPPLSTLYTPSEGTASATGASATGRTWGPSSPPCSPISSTRSY